MPLELNGMIIEVHYLHSTRTQFIQEVHAYSPPSLLLVRFYKLTKDSDVFIGYMHTGLNKKKNIHKRQHYTKGRVM